MQNHTCRTALTALLIFSLMFALNYFMPLHRDDYDYSMIWHTGVHITTFADVFDSLLRHYFEHGGRMVSFFFLDALLLAGKFPFDIANALVFLLLVLLLVMHARRSIAVHERPDLIAAAFVLAWLCLPHFAEVTIWKCGATVYLWSAVFGLLSLLPYNIGLRRLCAGERRRYTWAVLPMFFVGLLGSWSIENLAVTVVLVTFGAVLYAWKRHGFLPPWMLSGALGALTGLILLVAAPGNYVRYDEQGTGKGILLHIGNQFAGQGEMMLYLLPGLLLILTTWRLYRRSLAGGEMPPAASAGKGMILLTAVLALLTVSYFTGGWVAAGIREAVISGVLTPLGFTKPKTIHLFTNVMNGFEEMAIYWCALLLCYARLKQRLGLTSAAIRAAASRVPACTVLRTYPAARYAAVLMLLGLGNNLVMLAAPTFPGRATFSSAAMFITAALALLNDPVVRAALCPRGGLLLRTAAALLVAYTAAAALLITHEMSAEDAARIAAIKAARARGETVVHFAPIRTTNRALRHVFYEDWDNGVTADGAKQYFGLTDIVVDGK